MSDATEARRLTPEREERLRRALARRQDDLTLVLANIHDPHNVSAIYRSCDAFGVGMVRLYYTHTAFPVLGRKSSASARKWVDSVKYAAAGPMFADLHDAGFQVLATSFSSVALPLWQWDFLKPTAVILGNEHDGVEEELLRRADGELYIPMQGLIQSLNVSVAAAVILAEAARQRQEAGYFDVLRMDEGEYARRLELWRRK